MVVVSTENTVILRSKVCSTSSLDAKCMHLIAVASQHSMPHLLRVLLFFSSSVV